MDPAAPSPAVPAPAPHSAFVTVLAWFVIVVSAVAIPISVISFLMYLAGSPGTSTGSMFGWLGIVGGPPATCLAGIGLLRRKGWARLYLLALLCALVAYEVSEILKGPTPETTYISPAGVPTTRLAPDANYSPPVLVSSIGLVVMLFLPKIRAEFRRPIQP